MPDLDVVVHGLLRDVGVALRPLGFRGTGGVWRLITPEGVAVVQKQASTGSRSDEKLFFVNTAVVPKAWWEWTKGSAGPMDKAREVDGIRLLEGRVPCGDGDCWRVTADTDVERLRADLLAGVTRSAHRLVQLLEPGRYLDELQALPAKQIGHWPPLVVLLAERGPSPELDAACTGLRTAFAERSRSTGYVDRLTSWANTRAAG